MSSVRFDASYDDTSRRSGVSASRREDRSGGSVDKDGPMWSRDWPDREVARRRVSSDERSEDWYRSEASLFWSWGVVVAAAAVAPPGSPPPTTSRSRRRCGRSAPPPRRGGGGTSDDDDDDDDDEAAEWWG